MFIIERRLRILSQILSVPLPAAVFQQLDLDYIVGEPNKQYYDTDLKDVPIIRIYGVNEHGVQWALHCTARHCAARRSAAAPQAPAVTGVTPEPTQIAAWGSPAFFTPRPSSFSGHLHASKPL